MEETILKKRIGDGTPCCFEKVYIYKKKNEHEQSILVNNNNNTMSQSSLSLVNTVRLAKFLVDFVYIISVFVRQSNMEYVR